MFAPSSSSPTSPYRTWAFLLTLLVVLVSAPSLLSQQSSAQPSANPSPRSQTEPTPAPPTETSPSQASPTQTSPTQTSPNPVSPIQDKVQPHPDESAAANKSLVQLNNALEGLAAKVSPAVVQILVDGYGRANEENRSQTALIVRQHAVGSGVIVDSNGYIMTNAHVVEGAQRIRVALPLPIDTARAVPLGKRHILQARLVGTHKDTDLALLKIDETDLPTLPLLIAPRPRVGQLVFAIGSPEGLQNSVTMGVVSAVSRQPDPEKPLTYIQTDAPINPGNSGGPLVDMNGSVVGLNTFILSQGGGSEGLGFAIPARIVDFVYHSLRKYGHVHRTEIGAVAQEITPTMAEGLHLPQAWGVIIADVKPDGPAATAGLQVQDIVVAADDRRIETLPQLSSALYLHRLDQVLKMEILRGTERKTLFVPAIEMRDPMDQLFDAADPEKSLIPRLGILATDLTADLRNEIGSLRIPSGVIVLGRAADLITPETGLQTGDVIHSLNTAPIRSMDELRAAVQSLKVNDSVVLQVERSDGLTYLSFEME
ncbi:MAG: trypsin-like peptidase domain-containing protein [Candidatus Sulfotelmatobacter sp.]